MKGRTKIFRKLGEETGSGKDRETLKNENRTYKSTQEKDSTTNIHNFYPSEGTTQAQTDKTWVCATRQVFKLSYTVPLH